MSAASVPLALAALAAFDLAASIAASATPQGMPVTNAALDAAGREAALHDIDYRSSYCNGATTVGSWLKALVGREARAIRWSGGKCRLVNKLNPLDAGGRYCAQATLSLRHPNPSDDRPMIEICLDKPADGRRGAAYAFRSVMMTRDDGPDYLRFRKDFEAEWRERFPRSSAPACDDQGE